MMSIKQWIAPSLLVVLLGIQVFAPVGAGSIYKWTDSNGKVHYGDKPRSTAEEISITPHPAGPVTQPTDAERKELRQRLLNMYQEERERARVDAEKEKKLRTQAAKNCALSRDRLRNLERSAYVYRLDEQGDRVVLSDQHREEAIRAARQAIARWCKQSARK